jgi:hypothetical protein
MTRYRKPGDKIMTAYARVKRAKLVLAAFDKLPAVRRHALKVAQFIEDNPDHLVMSTYVAPLDDLETGAQKSKTLPRKLCNTAACLAGWWALLKPRVKYRQRSHYGGGVVLRNRAFVDFGNIINHDLNLTDDFGGEYVDFSYVMQDDEWPARFRNAYQKYAPEYEGTVLSKPDYDKSVIYTVVDTAKTHANAVKAAKIAADRLRHFVNTGR